MRYLQWSIVAICTAFPVILFIVPKGANTSFYLLLLFSLAGIAFRYAPMGKSFGSMWREYWPLHLAMAGLTLAILAHQLATGNFVLKTYDMSSRLAFFAFVFWIMLLMPVRGMKHFQWGLVIGAFVCAVSLYWYTAGGTDRPLRLFDIPMIPFGNIGLLMGVLAMFSIGWNDASDKASIALKLAAGAAAVYGSYLSQTRGAWLALPVFIVIAFALLRNLRLRHKLAFFIAAAALLCGSYMLSGAIQKRIDQGVAEIGQYFENKDPNTSVGIRLQLWRGSWLLLKESPAFGIGLEQYPRAMQRLVANQEVTEAAAAHPHSHNELLFHATTLGMPGLLAILFLYLVPAFYFFRDLGAADRELRTVAAMGLAVVLGYFIFGLTDVMFFWTVSHTFYAVVLAMLFAHLIKRKQILGNADMTADVRRDCKTLPRGPGVCA